MYLVSSAFSSSPNSILAYTKMTKENVHSHVYTENLYSIRGLAVPVLSRAIADSPLASIYSHV